MISRIWTMRGARNRDRENYPTIYQLVYEDEVVLDGFFIEFTEVRT